MHSIPLPELSRDAFVANVLWVGLTMAIQGNLNDDLDFRGTPSRGTVSCNNGQGDSIEVVWNEQGAVLLVHELGEPPAPPPDAPPALQELTQQALSNLPSVTAWLWITGDAVGHSRISEWPKESFLGLVVAFCGPSLSASDEAAAGRTLDRELFDAILGGQEELTEALVAALLEGPVAELAADLDALAAELAENEADLGGRRLEAARLLAENLGRFGLLWQNLELDVEQSASQP